MTALPHILLHTIARCMAERPCYNEHERLKIRQYFQAKFVRGLDQKVKEVVLKTEKFVALHGTAQICRVKLFSHHSHAFVGYIFIH